MKREIEQWSRELLCCLKGHQLLQQKYSYHKFSNDCETWVQECTFCKKPIFCAKGFVVVEPNFICMVDLDTSLEEIKKFPHNT